MTAERLWKAHDRIKDPQRWTQKVLAERIEEGKGPVERCLVGAILNVTCKSSLRYGSVHHSAWTARFQCRVNLDPDCQLVAEIVKEMFPDGSWAHYVEPWDVLTIFNDWEERTHEDVLSVMHKACIRCDEVIGS